MDRVRDCPYCASDDLEVVAVAYENATALAVHCRECGAFGPPCCGTDAKHATFAWNQRIGRTSVVK